jgi:hypothetical protein
MVEGTDMIRAAERPVHRAGNPSLRAMVRSPSHVPRKACVVAACDPTEREVIRKHADSSTSKKGHLLRAVLAVNGGGILWWDVPELDAAAGINVVPPFDRDACIRVLTTSAGVTVGGAVRWFEHTISPTLSKSAPTQHRSEDGAREGGHHLLCQRQFAQFLHHVRADGNDAPHARSCLCRVHCRWSCVCVCVCVYDCLRLSWQGTPDWRAGNCNGTHISRIVMHRHVYLNQNTTHACLFIHACAKARLNHYCWESSATFVLDQSHG